MNAPADIKSLYELAGIDDQADFYKQRYASNEVLNSEYFDAVNRFDIRWSRTMWVYDNVRRGANVLDAGCGSGLLALLKRKEVTLTGVDLSPECAAIARRNGYDATYATNLTSLPFADASFDYVVSLDVFGHLEFTQKDAVLREMSRVLKPDGVTLHGIECLDREKRKDYDEMNGDELRKFIQIDGHVGMESREQIEKRFSRLFAYLKTEPRYAICQSVEELVKQADQYDTSLCDTDLLSYLRSLSFDERRAFNMAMGYVFQSISDLGITLPKSEYLFVKASNTPLRSFYNEHLDRKNFFPSLPGRGAKEAGLDSSLRAAYESGWYAAENLPPMARWMGRTGLIRFPAKSLSRLTCDIICHMPDLAERPLKLGFSLNGRHLREVFVTDNNWQTLDMYARTDSPNANQTPDDFVLEIRADRSWQPCSTNPASTDDRELSVAVCNLQHFE